MMMLCKAREPALVFDLPTRVFHALLAMSFAGAFATAESERWRDVHAVLGYTVLVRVAFRLVWGLVGTRYARLSELWPAPRRAFAYLRSIVAGRPEHHAGHNPAGSLAIVGLLALALATSLAGLATFNELGGEWVADVHEVLATAMLALVGAHLIGVAVGSIAHRENLPLAMVTGRKGVRPGEAIGGPRRLAAVVLVALVALLWVGVLPTPGLDIPAGLTEVTARASGGRHHHRQDDD
jgi:cytochrome b